MKPILSHVRPELLILLITLDRRSRLRHRQKHTDAKIPRLKGRRTATSSFSHGFRLFIESVFIDKIVHSQSMEIDPSAQRHSLRSLKIHCLMKGIHTDLGSYISFLRPFHVI